MTHPRVTVIGDEGITVDVEFDDPDAGFKVLGWLQDKAGGAPNDEEAWQRGVKAAAAYRARMERTRRDMGAPSAGS